jgi:hypothetical protein
LWQEGKRQFTNGGKDKERYGMVRLKGLPNEKIYYAGIEKYASFNTFSPLPSFPQFKEAKGEVKGQPR